METESDIKGVVNWVPQSPQELSIVAGSDKSQLPKYWLAEHVADCLEKMPAGMHKMLAYWLWMSGTRITEALNVRKRDLDLVRFVARIRWLKSRKYQERYIALHPKLQAMLEPYTASMKADDRLFPITRQRALQVTRRWFGGSPHQFRHSFAVNWLRQGGRLETLSRHLGHSDIRYTMIYLSIVPMDIGQELIKLAF